MVLCLSFLLLRQRNGNNLMREVMQSTTKPACFGGMEVSASPQPNEGRVFMGTSHNKNEFEAIGIRRASRSVEMTDWRINKATHLWAIMCGMTCRQLRLETMQKVGMRKLLRTRCQGKVPITLKFLF